MTLLTSLNTQTIVLLWQEVHLMIKIVSDLNMQTIPKNAGRSLSNLMVDNFMGNVDKPHPFGAMLADTFPVDQPMNIILSLRYKNNIKTKISAQMYEDYSEHMHRNAALLMARQPRLGRGSALGELPEEIIRKIIKQREKIDLAEVGRAQRHLPLWLQSLPHS